MDKEEGEDSPKIFLTGLAPECSKSDLNTFFSNHGKVVDVLYKFGKDGKRVKGVAYVLFESEESVNKLLKEKTVTIDETEVTIKRDPADGEQTEDDDPLLEVPKEALKCFMCKREIFPSVKAYLGHKKGKQHQAVYKIFKSKSLAVFQLLKAEAKLASDRAYDSTWFRKNPHFNKRCELCLCNLVCKQEKHESTVEHKMVKNYNNQKCCDINFTSRIQYEEHLLTLKHLKKAYEREQQKKKNDVDDGRPNMKKAIDLYKQCDADLKELKETYGDFDINAELPEFDSNNPIGLNYIVKKINYYCVCCDQKFFAQTNLVEPHCRSYDHYINMTDYIVGVDKRIDKRKWEDEDGNPIKQMKKDEDKDSTLNKSAMVKNSNVRRKVQKKAADDDEENEEMDTVDKSNDDEEDVDQSESKDIDEEQEGGDDEEQEDDAEEQEEGDEDQDEGEVGEEEAAEDQEEVAEDSDVQEAKEEEEDEQMQSDEEEAKVTPPAEKNIDESPAEDSSEDKEEEEVAEESPKPNRGSPRGRRARGRGKGRGLKR